MISLIIGAGVGVIVFLILFFRDLMKIGKLSKDLDELRENDIEGERDD